MGKGRARERRSPLCPPGGLLRGSYTSRAVRSPQGPEEPREGGKALSPALTAVTGQAGSRAAQLPSPAAGILYIMGSQCSCLSPRRELENKFMNRSC